MHFFFLQPGQYTVRLDLLLICFSICCLSLDKRCEVHSLHLKFKRLLEPDRFRASRTVYHHHHNLEREKPDNVFGQKLLFIYENRNQNFFLTKTFIAEFLLLFSGALPALESKKLLIAFHLTMNREKISDALHCRTCNSTNCSIVPVKCSNRLNCE